MIKFNYIFSLVLFLFAILLVNGQVVIGDGLTISEGTTMTVKNQNVIIKTQKIGGEGQLKISNDKQQKIVVTKILTTDIHIDIIADDMHVIGNESQSFALHFLPSLTSDIILAKAKEEAKEKLPVRYINIEGKTFPVEQENTPHEEASLQLDYQHMTTSFVAMDVLQLKATTHNFYYILPIYSFLLNNERYSDYAELYEFKCLTALWKPPIV